MGNGVPSLLNVESNREIRLDTIGSKKTRNFLNFKSLMEYYSDEAKNANKKLVIKTIRVMLGL